MTYRLLTPEVPQEALPVTIPELKALLQRLKDQHRDNAISDDFYYTKGGYDVMKVLIERAEQALKEAKQG